MLKENNVDMAKIYPLTNKRKKKIFATIQYKKDEIYNIDYLKEFIKENNSLENIDLTKLLNMNLNKYTKCLFIEKQQAWISKNKFGKQRYFTKGFITYGLDIYDLLSIYFNCTYSKIFNCLLDIGINISNNNIDKLKYNYNIDEIINIIEQDESLNKILKDKIDIYIALNTFAKSNSLMFNRYKEEGIFFISTRFLKEKYSLPYSISTINQVINLYALIGLIYKVPSKELESEIYQAYTRNSKKAPINFYSIPKIDDILEVIKKNSIIIINQGITYYNLTQKKGLSLKEINNKELIYTSNRGGGDKTNKAKELQLEKTNIENLFIYYLKREGIVAKEWIKENIKINDITFNKKWRELTLKYNGKSIKPNKLLKTKYNLKTNQEIFIYNGGN